MLHAAVPREVESSQPAQGREDEPNIESIAVPRTGALQISHGQAVLGADSVLEAQEKWDWTGMLPGVSLCCSVQLIWYF